MNETLAFLVRHGALILFVILFIYPALISSLGFIFSDQ